MLRRKLNKDTFLKFLIYILASFILVFVMGFESFAKSLEYTVSVRSDGGYTIEITYYKRHWKPITAEGFFPTERKVYIIDVIGRGKDFSYRNQKGYYYSSGELSSKMKAWDFGYAWIDENREYLYLNLYWVSSPDGMTPSDVNSKYRLNQKGE